MRTKFLIATLILALSLCIAGCEKVDDIEFIEEIEQVYVEEDKDILFCGGKNWCETIDTMEDMNMLDIFVKRAAYLGLDLSYIYNHPIEFYSLGSDSSSAGISNGYKKDDIIRIGFNYEYRATEQPAGRLHTMFHELGHDILNYGHSNGYNQYDLKIMHQSGKDLNLDTEELILKHLDEMIIHYSNNN